jgi:DNA modification methylase
LADTGTLYVHVGIQVNHYCKAILDEVFGSDNFLTEVIWSYGTPSGGRAAGNKIIKAHEYLLVYAKNYGLQVYNKEFLPYSDKYLEERFSFADEEGRRYRTRKRPGGVVERQYLDESQGVPLSTVWSDINQTYAMHLLKRAQEETGYPTQKPEALLERIIKASSNEGDLILDCFCGSGTTPAVAEKLGRRWIAADLGRFAIHTTRKRLLSIPEVRPFVVQNLGRYERQAWQGAEFGDDAARVALTQAQYRRFILDLYGAQPLESRVWLHGVRAGRLVHVGSVDSPVHVGDIRAIAREFWKAAGKDSGAQVNAVDVLGWDFAFELNELGKQMAADAKINLSFKRIPRDVMDKKAVEQGDIRFFELAALDVGVARTPGRTVTVELCDFVIPPDDVPRDIQGAITHWSQWIDYWAVDWDYKGDTFHNQWQSYRTKKEPKLQLSATNTYAFGGKHTVVVKVIDILGNDTTKSLEVEVE